MGAHYNLRKACLSHASTNICKQIFHRSSNTRTEVSWLAQCCRSHSTRLIGVHYGNSNYTTMVPTRMSNQCSSKAIASAEYDNQSIQSRGDERTLQIGQNITKKEKVKFLLDALSNLNDSKEAVYGALDAWVAWEQTFPIVSLKRALIMLEKQYQWHQVVQVIKWMLSKGQGSTMGTYHQLIRALDMDHRAEEAHRFWVKKIGDDLHSVPWQLCKLMISIYYRNNMLERLVKVTPRSTLHRPLKLFKGLEAFDRKPPDKSVVQKVADAYEMLGSLEEKKRVLDKYNYLFSETWKGQPKKSSKASKKKVKKSEEQNCVKNSSETFSGAMDSAEAQCS